MKVAAIGLLGIAVVFAGCTQKSDVDKCVEAWEATVKNIADDDQKRFDSWGALANPTHTKTEARYAVRIRCMRHAAGVDL